MGLSSYAGAKQGSGVAGAERALERVRDVMGARSYRSFILRVVGFQQRSHVV